MSNIISKNWKKVLIVAGAVVLAILLFYKISWKPNVIEDYKKSDIAVDRDVIDGIRDTSKNITNDAKEYAEETDKEIEEKTGSRSVVGWIIIIVAVAFGILILDMLMQPSDDKKKKK